MKYAEVSVNAPAAQRQTFSYSIPSELTVNVGQAVYVPFGQKTVQGLVIELTDFPAFEANAGHYRHYRLSTVTYPQAGLAGKMAE